MFLVPLVLFWLQIARAVHQTPVDFCLHEGKVTFIGIRIENEQLNDTCGKIEIFSTDSNSTTFHLYLEGEPKFESFKEGWNRLGNLSVFAMNIWNQNLRTIPENLIKELPKELIWLYLNTNNISRIHNGILNGLRINGLYLDHNRMEYIEEDAFKGTIIKELFLSVNNLSSMEFVRNLPSDILTIYLSYNRVSSILPGIFLNLSQLLCLDLGKNNITSLEEAAFCGLQSLQTLDLSRNGLSLLNPNAFDGLRQLHTLDISENFIPSLPGGMFLNLEKLHTLRLNNNKFTEIKKETFRGLQALDTLDLSYNNLLRISPDSFIDLGKISVIYLKNDLNVSLIPEGTILNIKKSRYSFLKENNITDLDFIAIRKSKTVEIKGI